MNYLVKNFESLFRGADWSRPPAAAAATQLDTGHFNPFELNSIAWLQPKNIQ